MKDLNFSRKFNKSYAKRIGRNAKLDKQVEQRLILFRKGERGYPLDDHALTGNMVGSRAFSITADIRVIYIETDEAIIFLDSGTHNQVYL